MHENSVADADKGLDVLSPKGKSITIGGRERVITPVRMRSLKAFKDAIGPAVLPIMEAVDQGAEDAASDRGAFLEIIVDNLEPMMEAVAIGAEMSRGQVGELLPDEFLLLAMTVIEVNVDFFVRSLLPNLAQAASAAKTAMQRAAGSTASKR